MSPARRRFLQSLAATALPLPLHSAEPEKSFRLGLIADVHKDIIHDADDRLNTFVLSHQSLERPECIDNQVEVRAVIEAAKDSQGRRKVAACLNGHWHLDHHRVITGIPYLHVNSASYYWVGGKYQRERLDPALAEKFPVVRHTIPYTEPLFTCLEIDPAANTFRLTPAESAWMGPGPEEMDLRSDILDLAWIAPRISEVKGALD